MKYHFNVVQEGSGFWAKCLELEGCKIYSATQESLIQNMKDALIHYLTEPGNPKTIFPMPNKNLKGPHIRAVPIDPVIAWAVLLKNARLSRGLSQAKAAKALNIKNIYVYQKLESAKTANPGLTTIARVKKVFPEVNLEEILDT